MVELKQAGSGAAPAGQRVRIRLNCAVCHGAERQGRSRANGARRSSDVEKRLSRAAVGEIIEHGQGRDAGVPGALGAASAKRSSRTSSATRSRAGRAPTHGRAADEIVPYSHTGYNRFLDPDGYPAVKPPWGTLNAIDLNKGKIAWTRAARRDCRS